MKRAKRTFLIRHLPASISCAFPIRRRPIWRPAIMNGPSAKVHVVAVSVLFREATLRCLSGGAALICSVNTKTRRCYIKNIKIYIYKKKKRPVLEGSGVTSQKVSTSVAVTVSRSKALPASSLLCVRRCLSKILPLNKLLLCNNCWPEPLPFNRDRLNIAAQL